MSDDSADKRAVAAHPESFSGRAHSRWTSWTQADPDPMCFRSCIVDTQHRRAVAHAAAKLSELQIRSSALSTWCRDEVLRRVLMDVANELRDKGALDEAECFIDATFVMAKGGGAQIGPTKRRFGRVEGFKWSLEGLGSQSRTRILHRDEHALRAGFSPPDQQFSQSLAHATHRSIPLINKLRITCCSCTRSPSIAGSVSASSVRTETRFLSLSPRLHAIASNSVSLLSNRSCRGGAFLSSARLRLMSSIA